MAFGDFCEIYFCIPVAVQLYSLLSSEGYSRTAGGQGNRKDWKEKEGRNCTDLQADMGIQRTGGGVHIS